MRHLLGAFLVFVALLLGTATLESESISGSFLLLQTDTPSPDTSSTGPGEKKPDQPESYDVNYTYDPGGRRDPFSSLLGGLKSKGPAVPKGALTVADAKVVGITKSSGGFVAIIMGSDRKARFMHVGDKLYDGEIIGIEEDKVVFRQDITEELPTAPGLRSKEVVKRLHPVSEGT